MLPILHKSRRSGNLNPKDGHFNSHRSILLLAVCGVICVAVIVVYQLWAISFANKSDKQVKPLAASPPLMQVPEVNERQTTQSQLNLEPLQKQPELVKEADREMSNKKNPSTELNSNSFYRILFPLIAGFCFGFAGSIPVAGPTSAMVLKLGIQGRYWAGHAVALGGAAAEAAYAGIAFWGFGSFLANLQFLLPFSKVFGSLILLGIGTMFLRFEVRPQVDQDADASSSHSDVSSNQQVFFKNVLLGFTMSGINPALLATYTGAIATVYGTGMLEFTTTLAFIFAVGVCSGISLWFYLLLRLLKRYKQRIKNQTLGWVMRCMGVILICVGLSFTKASYDFFLRDSAST